MNRLPLADQLPYRFFEPKLSPFWLRVGRLHWKYVLLRKEQRVLEIDFEGVDRLKNLLGRGDGILITPNHSDDADGAVMMEAGRAVGKPFYFMTAYQILLTNGALARMLLPRIGAFPVDREGTDLRAFKTGVEILTAGANPLVVFPEGEVFHVGDTLTPIREGAASLAVSAAKKLVDSGKTAWIVPAAIKYRYLGSFDPYPELEAVMDRLEARFTWWSRSGENLIGRIYSFAEGLLGLKELEYLGRVETGPLKARIARLRDAILDATEDRLVGKRRQDTAPVRVKELRKVCLDALAKPEITSETAAELRRTLHDLFVVMQLFSYPGDYVIAAPSAERIGETLVKFEEDLLGHGEAKPIGPRRAIVKFGEPIDVGAILAASGKKGASATLTTEMERRIQRLLDEIGPGRPYPGPVPDSPLPPRLPTRRIEDRDASASLPGGGADD